MAPQRLARIHRIAAISYKRKRRLREVGELIRRLVRPVARDPADEALGGDLLRELRRLPATAVVRQLVAVCGESSASACLLRTWVDCFARLA